MATSKLYTLTINNIKTLSLTISNFVVGTGLRLTIKSLFIRMPSVSSALLNYVLNLRISNRMIAVAKLLVDESSTIGSLKVRILATMQLISEGLLLDIHITNPIIAVMSQLNYVASSIGTLRIRLNGTPLLGIFTTIGFYDPSTIGSMDSTTLGDLEFTAT